MEPIIREWRERDNQPEYVMRFEYLVNKIKKIHHKEASRARESEVPAVDSPVVGLARVIFEFAYITHFARARSYLRGGWSCG